jgi:hypothetical protein
MGSLERHRWPALARDWVHMNLPDPVPLTVEGVAKEFGLEVAELERLTETPEFRRLCDSERSRVERLGSLGPQVYRVESMLGPLTERLFERLMCGECKIEEYVKGFVALLRSAGLDQPVQAAAPSQTAVAVQINIPVLDGGKLSHVEALTVQAPDASEEDE